MGKHLEEKRLPERRRAVVCRLAGGFTLIELLVGLTLSLITVGFGGAAFLKYFDRTSAQRAAEVFARDLTLARSAAMRSRQTVVIRFFESSRWYQVDAIGSVRTPTST